MRFASPDAPSRPNYIDVGHGVSVPFDPDAQPSIQWNHIDGPLLHMRSGQIHWLTWRERFQCWMGSANAYTLEQKHAPEFVRRWLDHADRLWRQQRSLNLADDGQS